MLVAFTGLPGSGKSTIAKLLASHLRATYLRIDTIEQALLRAGAAPHIGVEGYVVAQAIAEDSLRAGAAVIVDAVNAQPISRDAWPALAQRLNVKSFTVGVYCSDAAEHRRRVEARVADIAGHALPTWADVTNVAFAPFGPDALVIDTARYTADEALDRILRLLAD